MRLKALLVSLCLVAFASYAEAVPLINGGFETGSFTPGWMPPTGGVIGSTSIEGVLFAVPPLNPPPRPLPDDPTPMTNDFHALLSTTEGDTGSPPVSVASLESFLDLPSGTLSALGAVEGSAIKQTIMGNSGDMVVFDWDFFTTDLDPSNNDFAFVALTQSGLLVKMCVLASIVSDPALSLPTCPPVLHPGTVPHPIGLFFETGYQIGTKVTLPSMGTFLLGSGIVHVADPGVGDSGLLVDSFVLMPQGIPVPGTFLLLCTGLASLALSWRIRKRQ